MKKKQALTGWSGFIKKYWMVCLGGVLCVGGGLVYRFVIRDYYVIQMQFANPDQKPIHMMFHNHTGLGDKLIDLIGSYTLAKYIGLNVDFYWSPRRKIPPAPLQLYDLTYFVLPQSTALQKKKGIPKLKQKQFVPYVTGCSLNPQTITQVVKSVYEMESNQKQSDDLLTEISASFLEIAQQISFSPEILQRIPSTIADSIGLHLRRSDKINKKKSNSHEHDLQEFEGYIASLEGFLKDLIQSGERKFFLCSEDQVWKQAFKEKLQNWGAEVIELSYFDATKKSGDTILDFAALSKTKMIIQGVKHSTFSIAASLIGNKQLVNMEDFQKNPHWLLQFWRPYLHLTSRHAEKWLTEKTPFLEPHWINQHSPAREEEVYVTNKFVYDFLHLYLTKRSS